jgi:hypothetical protein
MTEALSIGAVLWADGTYGAGCVGRSGNWSVSVSPYSGTTNYSPLSVDQNNAACVLTLTSVHADQDYTATPAIPLGTSYAGSASSFAPSSGGALAFYANAELSSVSFASSCVVAIVYSDNPSLATGSVLGGYVSASVTATATDINSPNYTLDTSGGTPTVNIDVNYVVQSVSGTLILDTGTIPGGSYFVDQGSLGASPTFAALDTAYKAASTTTISGSNPAVALSAFGLAAATLPVSRTIVIQRVVSGVSSYQTFRVTFNHP